MDRDKWLGLGNRVLKKKKKKKKKIIEKEGPFYKQNSNCIPTRSIELF